MNKIDCEICLDLIPLVKDDIASEKSREAVVSHIERCESCKKIYSDGAELPQLDDKEVLKKMKKRIFWAAVAVIILLSAVSVGFGSTEYMFYNILILPVVGIISFFALKQKSCFVPLGIILFSVVYWLIRGIIGFETIPVALSSGVLWGIIFGGIAFAGIVIGAFCYFVFRKRKGDTKKQITLRIIAGVIAFSMIAVVLYFANGLVGNPVSKITAKIQAEKYIEENYPDLDLEKGDVFFNFKTGGYGVPVKAKGSMDVHFTISCDGWGRVRGDTYDSVLDGFTVWDRINGEYYNMAKKLIASEEFPYPNDIGFCEILTGDKENYAFKDESVYGIPRESLVQDFEYDVRELGREHGKLVIYVEDEDVSAKRAAEIMLDITRIFDENDVPFKLIDFTLEHPRLPNGNKDFTKEDFSVRSFLYEDITEEGLEEKLREENKALKAYYEEEDKRMAEEIPQSIDT